MSAFDWLKKKPPAEQMAEIRRQFRAVFDSQEGTFVLAAILDDLGFWREATTPEAMALKNYATVLMKDRLGARDLYSVTQAVLSVRDKENA
jgi:hypothetical protein